MAPTVTIIPHYSGDIVVCPEGCVAVRVPDQPQPDPPPELDPIPELDLVELFRAQEENVVTVAEPRHDAPERPLIAIVVGQVVDLSQIGAELRAAAARGQAVEVHVYRDRSDAVEAFQRDLLTR